MDIDILDVSFKIGDESTFKILQEIREMTFFDDKTSLNPEDKKTIRKTYDKLFTKINGLKQTNY